MTTGPSFPSPIFDDLGLKPWQRELLERVIAKKVEAGELSPSARLTRAGAGRFAKAMASDAAQGRKPTKGWGEDELLVIVDDPLKAEGPEMTPWEVQVALDDLAMLYGTGHAQPCNLHGPGRGGRFKPERAQAIRPDHPQQGRQEGRQRPRRRAP